MAPASAPPSRRVIANVAPSPFPYEAGCEAIHSSALPSGYGWGMSKVFSAISRAPQRRCTSGASAMANGRRIRREVSRVGGTVIGVVGLILRAPELVLAWDR